MAEVYDLLAQASRHAAWVRHYAAPAVELEERIDKARDYLARPDADHTVAAKTLREITTKLDKRIPLP